MRNNWLFFPNLDSDGGCPPIFPIESRLSQGLGVHLLSQFGSLVDHSFNHSSHFYSSGSSAFQGAVTFISKFAGAFFVWLSAGPKNFNIPCKLAGSSHGPKSKFCQACAQMEHVSSCRNNFMGLDFDFGSNVEHGIPIIFIKLANSSIRQLWKEIEERQVLPMLSLTAAFMPPFDNLSSKVLSDSIQLVKGDKGIKDPIGSHQSPIGNGYRACSNLAISEIIRKMDAIESKTGIKFPTILDSSLGVADTSSLNSEVLVGTGSRSMRIVKLKTLKVYAFGIYVHPDSVCEKLGPKYASVPVSELEKCSDFYEDLLRENIHMSVRLVVNFNGLKINTVKDAFEKSLRNRLQKMNPNTDYHCINTFGSYFTHDIPLPVGTTIDFRQTADGQLITEIAGKHIGTVRSKDLCRAFFDMYIGDFPVSVQAKQEVAQNVAGLIRRCLR